MPMTRRLLLQTSLCLPALAAKRPLEEVVVVFKTHFDIGYTDLAREVVERYRTSMIDKALAVIDRSQSLPPEQRFAWTVSGWPMTQILWPGQDADRRRRVLDAFQRGQLVAHALPCTTHTESLDLEDVVRGLGFSSRLHRSLGMPLPRDAKMTDVPSHSWVLPVLLRNAGVEFLHLGCNAASSSPQVPLLFWWEGPDGSRLLTMYSAGGYGSALVPPAAWTHPVWLALIHTGDNEGPPSPEVVEKLIAEGREKLPGVRIRFGRLSDFSDALIKTRPDLPLVRGDMPDTWIHGLLSMPAETAVARNARPRIAAADSLESLLDVWAPGAIHPADIAAAREQSLLYGEHTWGMDAKKFPRLYGDAWKRAHAAGAYRKAEESYAEHGSYAHKAEEIASAALTTDVQVLVGAVEVAGERITVFNPLAWVRDGIVEMQTAPASGVRSLRDVATGQGIPVEAREAGSPALRFVARDVPALGYRTYVPGDRLVEALRHSASGIENEFLKVDLAPKNGGIRSIVDKQSGRELVDPHAEFALGQYLYERFSREQVNSFLAAYVKTKESWGPADFGKPGLPEAPYQRTPLRNMQSQIVSGPLADRATLHSGNITLTVTLYSGWRYVDLAWSIANKEPDPWPEAGWLCLPFNIPKPSFRLARLGGIVDPARDTVRGANNEVFCLNSGMAVLNADNSGVGICPVDSPLVSIGHPGLWKYSKEFGTRDAVVFVNLFNNQWSTNFAQWVGGWWTSRVRLWAIAKYDAAADLVAPSFEARSPLAAAFSEGAAGKLPPLRAGVAVSRPGVVVTAFGRNPDGPGLVLRLWEHAGADGPCTVTLPEGLRAGSVQPAGLRGQAVGNPVPVRDGRFTVNVSKFAPASFLIV